MDTSEAKKLLLEEQQARVDRTIQKINEILKEEKCTLSVAVLVTEKGNFPQVKIIPIDDTPAA